MKKKITKEMVLELIHKAVDDKKQVSKFIRGEITRKDLEARGIKLAKPF